MKTTHLVLGAGLAFSLFALQAGPASAQTCSGTGGCGSTVSSNYSEVLSGRYNTISSGSDWSVVSGGYSNTISSQCGESTIVGGYSNDIASYGPFGFIGGGENNYIYGGLSGSTGEANTIVGGNNNRMSARTNDAFIGGGENNVISVASGYGETIGGGEGNTISGGNYSTIGGGYHNTASGDYATVAGGYQNTASAWGATALGGSGNVASGSGATTVGGSVNTASGSFSFAAGRHANADQNGCFVWGDATGWPQSCRIFPAGGTAYSIIDSFVVRAIGGVELITGVDGAGTPNAGVMLYSGASTWSLVSDRNKKHDFQQVDTRDVLERVAAMPITTWQYDSEVSGARHMGPMAQDFYAAFGLGDDERHITSIDEDGVAMAALQGLYSEVVERGEVIQTLSDRAVALEKRRAGFEKVSADAHRRAAAAEQELAQIAASLGIEKPASRAFVPSN